jgi:ribosomal protein S18 acetylase RimI-like enzyme
MTADADLARLVETDYLAYVETYAATDGVDLEDLDGVRIRRSAIDDDYLNGVFGTRLDGRGVDDAIGRVIDRLGQGGRAFHWTIWPSDTPSDLSDRLATAGFEDLGTDPLMVFELAGLIESEPPPTGLSVAEAASEADLDAVADFAIRSMGWDGDPGTPNPFASTFVRLARERPPRLRLFAGRLDADVVAVAALFSGSGVAGIYAVATDAAVRGRGFGRALTLAAMRAGRDAGLRTAVLMASELGRPVYRRIGFREVGLVHFLRWPGA